MSSDEGGSFSIDNDIGVRTRKLDQPRVAKKSTGITVTEYKTPPTRRQTRSYLQKEASDKFLDNFDPETSTREKKKLNRRINSTARRVAGALYDENGIHIATGEDMCDCLSLQCPGCHFPCPKCKSTKCGNDCRVNRKFVYDQIEYHGSDLIVKNPLNKQ